VSAYKVLRARIETFFGLPLGKIKRDSARFKTEMERIGTLLS
jgi:arsenate reductase (thioredoxin)